MPVLKHPETESEWGGVLTWKYPTPRLCSIIIIIPQDNSTSLSIFHARQNANKWIYTVRARVHPVLTLESLELWAVWGQVDCSSQGWPGFKRWLKWLTEWRGRQLQSPGHEGIRKKHTHQEAAVTSVRSFKRQNVSAFRRKEHLSYKYDFSFSFHSILHKKTTSKKTILLTSALEMQLRHLLVTL